MREDQECLSDLSARLGVRTADPSSRYRTSTAERGAHERYQQGVLCTEHGKQGASAFESVIMYPASHW
jgi:hypothetical protein